MIKKKSETGWTGINDGSNNGWARGTSGGIKTVADLISSLSQCPQNKEIRWQSEKNTGKLIGISESSDNDYVYLDII